MAREQNIAMFSGTGLNIIGIALDQVGLAYIWTNGNEVPYPFLSWHIVILYNYQSA